MAIWQDATLSGTAPGDVITVGSGPDSVRVLSPKFLDGTTAYVGFGVQIAPGAGYPFANTEASDLVARMTDAPSEARKGQIDTLIGSLKAAGVWSKLDALYVMAAHDAHAARLNWKQVLYDLVPVNAPTFTADRGYQGDGSTSYLDSGFDPSLAGGLFAKDDAHIGVRPLTNIASNALDIGTTNLRISTRTATDRISGRINDASAINNPVTATTSAHHVVLSRLDPAGYSVFKDGGSATAQTVASSAIASGAIQVCAAMSLFSQRQIAVAHWGAGLTEAENAALYTATQTYLAAIGAV